MVVSKKTSFSYFEPQRILQPIVSTANIGQLAADLLISSLNLHRVGILNPRDLVPVVGAREDGEPGVTTPLERTASPYSPHQFYTYRISLRQTGSGHYRDPAEVPRAQGSLGSRKPILP